MLLLEVVYNLSYYTHTFVQTFTHLHKHIHKNKRKYTYTQSHVTHTLTVVEQIIFILSLCLTSK